MGHVGGEDAFVVLGKAAVVKTAGAKRAVEELAPEEIVAELFAEEAFAADGVERGQHVGLEQLLGRDAGAPVLRIEFGQERRALFRTASTWVLLARSG